jgi:hypothetical protein
MSKRLQDFRDRVARLPSRGSRERFERSLALVGAGVAFAGLALILVGWYGAAHTPYMFEQLPYAISGGLLGLALVFIGGFAYFAYWMTRLVQQMQAQSARTVSALERIASLLAPSPSEVEETFVATRNGTLYHRPDCAVVSGRSGVRRVRPGPGLSPCRLCLAGAADAALSS